MAENMNRDTDVIWMSEEKIDWYINAKDLAHTLSALIGADLGNIGVHLKDQDWAGYAIEHAVQSWASSQGCGNFEAWHEIVYANPDIYEKSRAVARA